MYLYLDDPIVNDDDTLSLLSADLQAFHSHIPAFVPAISNIISSELTHLKSLANATPRNGKKNNLSSSSRVDQVKSSNRLRPLSLKPSSNVSLSTQLCNRLHALRAIQLSELPTAQRQMAVTAAAVLSAHAQVMERTIQVLERTKHGSWARAGKARAEHLAKVAEGMEAKAKYDFPKSRIPYTSMRKATKRSQDYEARNPCRNLHTRNCLGLGSLSRTLE